MNNVLRRAFIRAATLGASIGCIAAFASGVQAADVLKSTDAQEPPAIEQKLKTDKTIKRKRLVNVNAAAIASAILPPGAFLFAGLLLALKNLVDSRRASASRSSQPAPAPGSRRVRSGAIQP